MKNGTPDTFQTALQTPMSAKRLVLSLFGALDDATLPISKLIVGASVFGIEESAVRMAANRLVNDGVLSSLERGWYGISDQGETLYEASRAWQKQNERMGDWTGEWVVVHVAHLGRSDRQALRRRNRAFMLCGFAELESGLWVRPNNLTLSTGGLRAELVKLGLGEGAVVFRAAELIHQHSDAFPDLWDRNALESSYHSALAAMAESASTLDSRPLDVAAREVHEIGSSVVSVLTHDPLLPDPFVDTSLRQKVYGAMRSYDALGKSIWEQLFAETTQWQENASAAT
tara:strand:- start:6548 stop:7405 length:858 start_codon:yes stop_codon:yes gene_type:complete